MSTIAATLRPIPFPTATALRSNPAAQAFLLLRIAFIVAPILFGLDKFAEVMINDWPKYLAPEFNDLIPGSAQNAMYIVGAVEILAGIIVARHSPLRRPAGRGLARRHHRQPAAGGRLRRHRAARLRPADRRARAQPTGERELPSHSFSGTRTLRAEKSPSSRICSAAFANAAVATRASWLPTLMRLPPASAISPHGHAGDGKHVDGLGGRVAHGADLLRLASQRRVEHIGAGALVGLQARDRVVQVGVVAEVVLGARREREREADLRRGLGGRGDPLGRVARCRRCRARGPSPRSSRPTAPASAARVTARAASSGSGPVAVLHVHRDRQVSRRGEHRRVLHHLVERDVAVEPPEREREPGARGRQRLEAQCLPAPSRSPRPTGSGSRTALPRAVRGTPRLCSAGTWHLQSWGSLHTPPTTRAERFVRLGGCGYFQRRAVPATNCQ